jgi:acetate kinase
MANHNRREARPAASAARRVLVINCGSTTLKFQLIEPESGLSLVKGSVDRIGRPDCRAASRDAERSLEAELPLADHAKALAWAFDSLPAGALPDAVGHRVVHGGDYFGAAALADEDCLRKIEACSPLAPLHNPIELAGIRACMALHPELPQIVTFDTAFHRSRPRVNAIFGLPLEWAAERGYRKFGFHGASHKYVSERAARLLGRDPATLRLVTCHLGGGSSVAAVAGGVSIDSSASFGTCTGMPMGTRSGDIDAGVILDMETRLGMKPEEVHELLYKKSGLLGLSGVSGDMAELERLEAEGHEGARLARDYFAYCLKRFIGAYAAAMDGIDGIVFTAGIGEHDADVRERTCRGLGWMGAILDPEKNRAAKGEAVISSPESQVAIMVIPTNEELAIAREVAALLGGFSAII